jgi:uncharacterized membrane protein YgdD (TMEM256/DUF423 family)|tara:strand:+ start:795 stop:1166 length:372 start_codon:yes stop_codon:yes gene_type:complete
VKPSAWIVTGAVFGFLAVALGAFGAHGLKSKVTADTLSSFETAARYQIYHALALILVGVLANTVSSPLLEWSGRLFATGVVLFSGSIYLMVFTGVTSLGVVTPFGGLCFLAGWAALAVAAYRG